MTGKQRAVIIDLDSTLANNDHRKHFVENKPKDFDAFYAGIPQDKVNEWCEKIMEAMECVDFKILLVTGREGNPKVKQDTLDWLSNNCICYDDIFFRKEKDYRPDTVVKEEIYKEHIEPNYNILFCVDDRPSVVRMWRSLGLTCLQCDDKEF